MKIVSIPSVLLCAVMAAALSAASVFAQESASYPSAKAEALAASGTLRNPNGGDAMVARAIYVKLRKGAVIGTPAATVQTLAANAGLRPALATPLPFTQMPVEKQEAARLLRLSPEKQRRIQEAQDNLSRLIELSYSDAMLPTDAARIVAAMPGVEYAEPIYIPAPLGSPAPPNDPFRTEQTHLQTMQVYQAWEQWKGDTNTVIAIVDDGIDMFHEDLAPNIKENAGEVGQDAQGNDKRTNLKDDDANGAVDDWRGANLTYRDDASTPGNTKGGTHGTTVSGLAAAMTNNNIGIAGTGYLCRLFPIKTALKSGGLLIRAYEGIIFAARSGYKVINCSFGGESYSQGLQDIITSLVEMHDCSIVAAAGNDPLYRGFYPAGYDHVLGVGALNLDNTFGTTWGEQVDVAAMPTFSTTENSTYGNAMGATSFASPVISGIMGLVRSKFKSLNADQAAEHLRLTSDVLPGIPDKTKLTGYGRANALRAVTVDPFSHPAILVDSVWMTDLDGVAIDRAPVGRFNKLRLRLRNILGNASNVRVRISMYNADSASLSIKDTTLTLDQLNTNETAVPDGGITFQLKKPDGARLRFRVNITANGNYDDYRYQRMLFYIPYTTYRSENVTMSLTDRGRIGFEDYPENTIGDGLRYTDVPFLYEGGFIVASDPFRVLSNIRTSDKSVQRSDFTVLEYPTAANNFTLALTDATVGDRRIGVELRVNVITKDTVSDGIAIQVRTKYVGSNLLDSLRTAMYFDWDLDSSEVAQAIDYREAPKTNVPFYGLITNETGYYVTQGVARPADLPIFFAIRNDSLPMKLFEGFGDDKKWYTVANGIGSRRAPLSDSSDVSLVIGKRLARLIPGTEDTTLYVIGIATSQNDALKAMRSMAPPYKEDTSTVGVLEEATAGGARLALIAPNPFTRYTQIHVNAVPSGATLRVYDTYGRLAADLTDQLARHTANGVLVLDAGGLPGGLYQVELVANGTRETRNILLIH